MSSEIVQTGLIQPERYFGCVFCKTNHEDAVANHMKRAVPSIQAYPVIQAKHKSEKGKRLYTYARVFPGYVFFETTESLDVTALKRISSVLKVLGDDDWVLSGSDREFARWVVDNKGLIDVSIAFREGKKISFRTGLLKEYEGSIVKTDKHQGNAIVDMVFNGVAFRIWVAFEWVDALGSMVISS